jgi:hypothetical protein
MPAVSAAEDFLEKLKKAAEQAAQQRKQQRQQQQSGQPRQQQQQPQQSTQSPQQSNQTQQQPRYVPGGTPRLPDVKPQPSPDFGTPEGTAKIAAKAGFMEVVGIKLGMPVKEAVDALKAYNAGYKPGALTLREYEALPGVVMTPVLHAPNPGGPNATSGDDFNLLLTYAPNEAYVWGIVRSMGFGTNATRPPVDSTLAGLRQKYGPESTQQLNSRLIWIYDAQRQQVMGQKAMDIWNQCSQTWMVGAGGSIGGNNPDRNNQFSNSYFDQQLKGGYYYGTGNYGSPGGVCHTHSIIEVYYTHAIPAGSAADLMTSMIMGVHNHQLEASGVTASHINLMAAVGKLNEKRGEEESKRGGMKF